MTRPRSPPPQAMLFIQTLQTNPVLYLSWVFGVMLSIVLHELGHGLVATWQGDETPRLLGHLTWDPMVHMGAMSIGMLFIIGIAWGRMPVNPSRFRSKFGDVYVSLAGPAVNVLIALVALTVLGVWRSSAGRLEPGAGANIQQFFGVLGMTNIALAVLNLLPIPPLDGSTALAGISPGFARFANNPDNGPIFTGAFILLVFTAGTHLWPAAWSVADAYLGLFPAG